MPVPSPEQYKKIIANAKANNFALPAINVTSMITANAAIAAFAEAKADGIIQLSLGGAEFASGSGVKDAVIGAASVAEHVHRVTKDLPVYIALHTDHCQADKLHIVRGLLEESRKRVAAGQSVLFNGHMFDGSALPLEENMKLSVPLLRECRELGIVLEVEAGIVGGEEDGAAETDDNTKLYTSPEDMLYVADTLFPEEGDFMFAATFGNVHGIYKPGNVKLDPSILKNGQAAVREKYGEDKTFALVFHGGSGTPVEQIRETLQYGVIKMNVDTATQFAFTQPIVEHMCDNSELIRQADGDGSKKLYDPRSYLKKAEQAMKTRVLQAIEELCATGKTQFGSI